MTSPQHCPAGLCPSDYEHELETAAEIALKKPPFFLEFLATLEEHLVDAIVRLQHAGSYLQITRSSLPDVFQVLETACRILDVGSVPDLYVQWDDDIAAFTTEQRRSTGQQRGTPRRSLALHEVSDHRRRCASAPPLVTFSGLSVDSRYIVRLTMLLFLCTS